MNCDDSRIYLTAYLDDELDVAESLRVQKHLAECGDCRQAHVTCVQKSLSVPPGFHGAYVPIKRWMNPCPFEVPSTTSMAMTRPFRAG